MISDLFTSEMVLVGSIERKSKIVIRPLGAINKRGRKGSLESFS